MSTYFSLRYATAGEPYLILLLQMLSICTAVFQTANFSVYYHAKLHIITETHIQTRKLRAVSVFVSYLPFFNSIFRQTNTPFSQNRQYPTPFYLSVLYYHGNPGLLRESILLPDSTIFPPIAILSAASKNTNQTPPRSTGQLIERKKAPVFTPMPHTKNSVNPLFPPVAAPTRPLASPEWAAPSGRHSPRWKCFHHINRMHNTKIYKDNMIPDFTLIFTLFTDF